MLLAGRVLRFVFLLTQLFRFLLHKLSHISELAYPEQLKELPKEAFPFLSFLLFALLELFDLLLEIDSLLFLLLLQVINLLIFCMHNFVALFMEINKHSWVFVHVLVLEVFAAAREL